MKVDEQIRLAFRAALSGRNGDIIRKELEYYANMETHVPGDPHTSAYNDGKRIMARNFLLLGEVDE